MTALDILKIALLKVGISKHPATTNEASAEAYVGGAVYDHVLRLTLRRFPWSWATKYATLDLTQGPAWTDAPVQAWTAAQVYAVGDVVTSGGVLYYCTEAHTAASPTNDPPNASFWSTTATERANGDWDYAYRHPDDCLFVRRVVPAGGHGREFNTDPIRYRIGRDANGRLIYTHEQDAVIEYTQIDCDNLWADDLFIEAYTWRLGAALAPSLSKIEKREEFCLLMFERAVVGAATVDMREQQQDKDGDAEWLRLR